MSSFLVSPTLSPGYYFIRTCLPSQAAGPSGKHGSLLAAPPPPVCPTSRQAWAELPTSRKPNKHELRGRGWGRPHRVFPPRLPWKSPSRPRCSVSRSRQAPAAASADGGNWEPRAVSSPGPTSQTPPDRAVPTAATTQATQGAWPTPLRPRTALGFASSPSSPARPHSLPGPDPTRQGPQNQPATGSPEVGPGPPQAGLLQATASPRGAPAPSRQTISSVVPLFPGLTANIEPRLPSRVSPTPNPPSLVEKPRCLQGARGSSALQTARRETRGTSPQTGETTRLTPAAPAGPSPVLDPQKRARQTACCRRPSCRGTLLDSPRQQPPSGGRESFLGC